MYTPVNCIRTSPSICLVERDVYVLVMQGGQYGAVKGDAT